MIWIVTWLYVFGALEFFLSALAVVCFPNFRLLIETIFWPIAVPFNAIELFFNVKEKLK